MLLTTFYSLLTVVAAGKTSSSEPQFTPHKTDAVLMDCKIQGTTWTEVWFNTDIRRPEFHGSTIVTPETKMVIKATGTSVEFPNMIAFDTVKDPVSGKKGFQKMAAGTFKIHLDEESSKQHFIITRNGVAETHDFFPLVEEGNDPTFEGDEKEARCKFTGYVPNLTFTI